MSEETIREMSMKQICKTCKWWGKDAADEEIYKGKRTRCCVVEPPKVFMNKVRVMFTDLETGAESFDTRMLTDTVFPRTKEDTRCGKWEKR